MFQCSLLQTCSLLGQNHLGLGRHVSLTHNQKAESLVCQASKKLIVQWLKLSPRDPLQGRMASPAETQHLLDVVIESQAQELQTDRKHP